MVAQSTAAAGLKPPSKSATTAAGASTGWSDKAIHFASLQSIRERKKLQDEGVIHLPRKISIYGQPLESEQEDSGLDSRIGSTTTTKIIHFQRHGQGFHNTIYQLWSEFHGGEPVDLSSKDPRINPLVRPDVLDAPLTHVGRQQCADRQGQAARLQPHIMIVSPLLRALESAQISWNAPHHAPDNIPWVVHEACREELGLLVCNQRRHREELHTLYPHVDLSLVTTNHDTLFVPERRESVLDQANRIYNFLRYIRQLPQQEIAVVGHSAWLFTMCNAVMKIDDDALKSWFLTSEIRSMKVTFTDNDGEESDNE